MRSFIFLLAALVLFVSPSFTQESIRDLKDEEPIYVELRKIDPALIEVFTNATNALDSGDAEKADELFSQVLSKAPEVHAATRRRAYALSQIGKREEALRLTSQVVAKDRSIDNLVGRASVLFGMGVQDFRPNASELAEIESLSKEAWQKSNFTDEASAVLLAETLLMQDKLEAFESHAQSFFQFLPESNGAGYFYALSLANRGDFTAAEEQLDKLKEKGFPAETIDELLSAMSVARDESYLGLGRFFKYGYIAATVVGIWAVGLFLLYVVGQWLSSRTLDAIERSDPNDIAGAAQGKLKNTYRKVVSIAGFYYYISQPFVIFLLILSFLAVLIFFLWLGTIPIKLVAVVGIVAIIAIFYMIKSLFIKVRPEDPGRVLQEREAPGLWALARDVAQTINTRPVDEIRITHGTDLAVYERGSFRQKMTDKAERILILGTGVIGNFEQNAFRAVLAHEYGHFSNRDTAGGDIAFRVNVDLMRTAEAMINSGTATFYNLGFQFLRLFHFIFRRITHGATRLQEVLANRVAAYHFGPAAFKEGLDHVVRRELEFNAVADKEINAAMSSNRPVNNIYTLEVEDAQVENEIDQAFRDLIDRPTTKDDTHPSPKDRYRYLTGIDPVGIEPLNGKVWELFADEKAITAEMNALVEGLVRPSYSSNDSTVLGI